MASERRTAFLTELSTWLPNRTYSLLYRGSRDGMTFPEFHRLCDRKGPTLSLVRCDQDWVFGGYACASWDNPARFRFVANPDAFVFSVVGLTLPGPCAFLW